MNHTDMAVAAVTTAANLQFQRGEFDPSSETAMAWLEESARALANLMFQMASRAESSAPPAQQVAVPPTAPSQPAPDVAPPSPVVSQGSAHPFPQAQAAPAGHAPPPAGQIDENSSKDELWAHLVQEMQAGGGRPADWWDNRLTKKSQGAADFAHKNLTEVSRKTGRTWPIGLWMKSAPDWAREVINQYQPPQ